MRLAPPSEEPQARRGIDYATLVYVAASARTQHEVFDCLAASAEQLSDIGDWRETGRSTHFDRVFSHPTGCRIELTELNSTDGRNKGMTVYSLPGAAFYLQTGEEQALMLWRLVNQEGFKWFSRLDFMNTELSPEWDVDRVHQAVEAGEVWVKGHRSYRQWAEVLPDGSCPAGRTLYWGSTRSERQGRTYDKARQLGWKLPAIRDEVQLRGEWAHAYGREVRAALTNNITGSAMAEALSSLAVNALNQHLQYQTLNGADPKADKNWTRKAEPADWFQNRIGKRCEPLQKAPRQRADLETSVEYAVITYGRSIVAWVESHAQRLGLDRDFVLSAFYARCFARMRAEDFVGLGLVADPAVFAEVEAHLEELKDELAIPAERGWWPE